MELEQIKELIALLQGSNIAELKYEKDGLSLQIRTSEYNKKQAAPAPVYAPYSGPMPMPQFVAEQQAAPQAQVPQQPQAEVKAAEPAAVAAPKAEAKLPSNVKEIKSPMVGTFYRSSSPDKPPFVKVGDEVGPNDTVCLIEAMKLFNEIKAEMSGRVVKVLCDDASAVEYDQVLFLIEPLV